MATRLFEAQSNDVLYVVDISGYVFRAYHAISPLSSPSGEPTQAVFGTVNMLERLVRQCKPRMLAVAMDSRTRNFRYDIFPEYKATRPPPPPDLTQQMTRVAQIISAFAIPVFQQDGVEADDLIACAVKEARQRNLRVVIVSADKDLMQLVGPDVLMWDTMRDRVFGVDEVVERFGVSVSQVRDFLALTGDSSDNVPGVPSVGPKTAKELLLEHGSIEGIYANLERVQRAKLRETLREHEEQARLSQKLVTLREDCELHFDPKALAYGGRDVPRLRALYKELGFTRQLAALEQEGQTSLSLSVPNETRTEALTPDSTADRKELPGDTPAFVCIGSIQELEGVVAELERGATRLSLEVVTSSSSSVSSAWIGTAFAARPERAYYVPLAHRYIGAPSQIPLTEVARILRPLLANPRIAKTGHDLKHALVVLERHGLAVANLGFDTLLAAYVLDPSNSRSLEELALTQLGVSLKSATAVPKKGRTQPGVDEISVEEMTEIAGGRARAELLLSEKLARSLEDEALNKVMNDIELPLTALLADLEARGVLIDGKMLKDLGSTFEAELLELERRAHAIMHKSFNVHSPRQLETILFDELGLKPLKRTKTSRSTDAATLEALSLEHELPNVILEIRQLAKLKSTYIDALPELIDPRTGRVHTRWGQAVAATGRLSSSDPNLQNIPIRSEIGRRIRSAFIAPPNCVLVSGDYSQIELRVLAHLSQDPRLLEAFRAGQDVHTRTAMEIFGLAEHELTAEHRRRAKAVNFGVIYGQGDSGLAKSLGIPRVEAGNFIATYFRRYEGVRRFMDETLERARAGDAVRTLFGRRRLIPDIKHANRAVRLAAERIAMNTPIQGTAADLLKLAMLAFRKPVTPGSRMILSVHDELVFEVPIDEVAEASPAIKHTMETVYPLDVPLVVEIGQGKNWNEAH
jgi:DNA polymerase-1